MITPLGALRAVCRLWQSLTLPLGSGKLLALQNHVGDAEVGRLRPEQEKIRGLPFGNAGAPSIRSKQPGGIGCGCRQRVHQRHAEKPQEDLYNMFQGSRRTHTRGWRIESIQTHGPEEARSLMLAVLAEVDAVVVIYVDAVDARGGLYCVDRPVT